MSEPTNIGSAFLAQVRQRGDAPFIVTPQATLSWRDVATSVSCLRRFFASQGVGEDDIIGLACADQVLVFQSVLALWSLGAMPIVLDFRSSQADLTHFKTQTGFEEMFSDLKAFQRKHGARALSGFAEFGGALDELTFPERPEALAEIATSSGATSLPTIHLLSTQITFDAVESMVSNGHRGDWGNLVSCLNLAFSGTRHLWYRNAISGRQIISVPIFFNASELDAALSLPCAQEATLPPVVLMSLTEYLRNHHPDTAPRYPHLTKLQSIGGPLVGDALVDAKTVLCDKLCVTYSSSQTGIITRLEGPDIEARPYSVGKPINNLRIEIDGSVGHETEDPRVGRIIVHGSASHVTMDDLGYLDEDGFLHITGRAQGVICRNGVSFHAESLERQISEMDAVTDCCVVPHSNDGTKEDTVIAAVEVADIEANEAIRSAIMTDISALKRPDHLLVTRALPRTSGMKISKAELIRAYLHTPEAFYDLS